MPVLKLSLSDDESKALELLAEAERLSPQDYIRFLLFGNKPATIFTPEEAERRAIAKFKEGELFSLPDIYGYQDWCLLEPRKTGPFGKKFFQFVQRPDSDIVFVKMTANGRRALYSIKKHKEDK